VPNLWCNKYKGKRLRNPLAKLVDINKLPFDDFSIFDKQRFLKPMWGKIISILPINLDRGCPYQCSFCNSPSISRKYKESGQIRYYRQKSIERLYQELKFQLNKYKNVEFLYFNSETLLARPLNKLQDFAKMYSEFNLPFWCQTRFETVTDEKIKILKEMNCSQISVGLEHGNENFRKKVLKKTFSNQQVKNAFKIFNKHKIKITVNNMLGFPGETRKLIFDTINLNKEINPDSVNGFVVQPYTGTEIYNYCIEKGLLAKKIKLSKEAGSIVGDPIADLSKISRKSLMGFLRTFVLYVKMPKIYYPKIKIAENFSEEGNKSLEELREVLFNNYF
jgi:radical SAM superfamily enzyme YgiQ (UPF0313 family)